MDLPATERSNRCCCGLFTVTDGKGREMKRLAVVFAVASVFGLIAAGEAKAGLLDLVRGHKRGHGTAASGCAQCAERAACQPVRGHGLITGLFPWASTRYCPCCPWPAPGWYAPCARPYPYIYPMRAPRDFWMLR